MTGISVRTTHLTQTFDELNALDGVTLEIRPGTITGLLGRNGAGKSTLLSIVAGLKRPTSGEVLVDGEDPFENALSAADTQLMRESGDGFATERVSVTLDQYRDRRENWSGELAGQLIDTFELNVKQKLESLSRGQASMVGAVIGLASRAPLTIFDETYLGMDAPNRYAFYDALLTDYADHPRTIVISSHLISEVERIFEDVVILDAGRLLVAGSADEIRASGLTLTGRAAEIARLTAGREVLARTDLGPTAQVTLVTNPTDDLPELAEAAGLDVAGINLQDLFVHLTRKDRS